MFCPPNNTGNARAAREALNRAMLFQTRSETSTGVTLPCFEISRFVSDAQEIVEDLKFERESNLSWRPRLPAIERTTC